MTAQTSKDRMAFELPAMLSYHSTWDDADYEPTFPSRRGLFAKLSGVFLGRVNTVRARNAARAELAAMSDRELADIGVSRYDMNRLFDPAFVREHGGRGI